MSLLPEIGKGAVIFARALRGYDPGQVDPLVRAAGQAAMSEFPQQRVEMARTLRDVRFRKVWRGYQPDEVDAYLRMVREDYLRADEPPSLREDGGSVPASPGSAFVLRGYDVEQVDELIDRVQAGLRSDDPGQREAARTLLSTSLRVTLRGYDREQVDAYLARLVDALG